MSNFKKIVSAVLSLIMISSFGVFASAASTDTNVNLTTSFDNSGQYLQVTISTTNAVAGLMGTFTYNATAVEFLPANTVLCGTDNTVADSLNYSAGSISLAVVGDVVTGTTQWATLSFKVLQTANVAFALSNVSACNVDEQDVYTTINNKTINVSVEALATLGAQIRQETSTTTIHDIRFGSKLNRNVQTTGELTGEIITVGGNSYKATSCGYLVALTSKLAGGEQMTVNSTNLSVKNKPSTKCYLRQDTYFIYTVVITGITDTNKDAKISVRPYVVYDDGGTAKYFYGDQVSKSVNDVANVSYN